MKELILNILKENRNFDSCNDLVLWASDSDLLYLANELEQAINPTLCCKELICDHCDNLAEHVISMCNKCDSNING